MCGTGQCALHTELKNVGNDPKQASGCPEGDQVGESTAKGF